MRRIARRLIRTPLARRIAVLLSRVVARIENANAQSVQLAPAPVWAAPEMPSWLRDELLEAAFIEPELLPPGTDASRYAFYSVPSDPAPGRAYFEILSLTGGRRFTHVLLVPWLKQGGADRGIVYHARAIAEAVPGSSILVLATENAESPWAEKLPDNALFLPVGRHCADLGFEKQVGVVARLLVQLRAPLVHIVNSRVGWELVRQYPMALRQTSAIYASLFCDDYDARMMPVGFARDYLRDCHGALDGVFCDNSRYPALWSRELGIPSSIFSVLPFPYDGDFSAVPDRAITRPGAGRVLWAGRLDRQKRPDLLARIAALMPDVHFDVYGTAVMSQAGTSDIGVLKTLPNVTMRGEFERLENVAGPDHFAYLHTTAWEGTPTILFDVAATGLPICAPAVGGIVDFIPSEQLIPDHQDVEAFVDRLAALRGSVEERDRAVHLQRESLLEHRRWAHFIDRLRGAGRYLSGTV